MQKYLIWQVSDRAFDWFRLREGEYTKLQSDEKIIKSKVFLSLWLAIDSLLDYDLAKAIATVQKGIETKEHQDFIHEISS